MDVIFRRLRASGFNLRFSYHSDAILQQDFSAAAEELDRIICGVTIPIVELIRGGGGEAQVTQRLRNLLDQCSWTKRVFNIVKKIDDRTTFAQSHEVDHVKGYDAGNIALEIEWNNKDPFFDRDLENFNRLHADGGINVGIIVTRGDSFQDGIEKRIREFADENGVGSFADLDGFGVSPTQRQRTSVEQYLGRNECSFADAWAVCFTRDKFGSATTHWAKLISRLDRGVGSPCPTVGRGVPLSCIT